MAVAAVMFICHPIGPQIALFKHMNPYVKVAGPVDHMGVNWPCIIVKNDVGDGFLAHKRCKGLRPIAQSVAIAAVAVGPRSKDAITGVKADAPDFGPSIGQHFAQRAKKWPMRALQKHKYAFDGGDIAH